MRALLLLVLVLTVQNLASASVCDVAWDGDKIVSSYARSSPAQRVTLRKNGQDSASVTVGQVRAFFDAKDRITRLADASPSFIVCGDTNANAFASSVNDGLVIGVTVGMLELVDGDADMAAAVIGHEYAHHVKGHVSASRDREALVDFLGLVVGIALEAKLQKRHQSSGLGLDIGQLGSTLVSRKFDRDQEREADRVGFDYMVQAGFDPNGAIALATRMKRAGSDTTGLFLDTHPGWPEREDEFRRLIAQRAPATPTRDPSPTQLARKDPEPQIAKAPLAFVPAYSASDAQKGFTAGASLYRSGDVSGAMREFKASADAGYARSQSAVAYFYWRGLGGLPKDEYAAVRYYKLAADQGSATAQAYLAGFHQSGRGGLKKDEAEAVRLYREAAGKGNAAARAGLGYMYANGKGGLVKDDVEAVRLYKLATDSGNAQGQVNLGFMYATGRGGLPRDESEALRLYRLSADKGNSGAYYNLGQMYEAGSGVLSRNATEAARYYKLAADKGNAHGQAALGVMYLNGRGGLPKDDAEALRLFRLAAGQDQPIAQANLGLMYETGRGGLTKDVEAAVPWYRLAARQGRQFAIDALRRLGRE